MKKLSNKSLRNLNKVNPKLTEVVVRALERGRVDFSIISGMRTAQEQNELYKQGRSKPGNKVTNLDGYNKKSYHQTGKAVDFIPYPFDGNWNNTQQFQNIGEELKEIAKELGYPCEYGGDWGWDWGHFQLS